MTDLLIFYFEMFGDKSCCGNDLKLYLPNLDASEIARFFESSFNFITFENSMKRPITVRLTNNIINHFLWLIVLFRKLMLTDTFVGFR